MLCGRFLGPAAFGQTLTASRPRSGREYLEQTRDGVIAATKDLSEAQWKFKLPRTNGRGRNRSNTSHLPRTTFLEPRRTQKSGPAGATRSHFAKIDAMILQMTPDRSEKRQAPPPLVPTGRWTPAETLDHFPEKPSANDRILEDPTGSSRATLATVLSAPWTPTNGLIFLGRTRTHHQQMLELKASPDFPKN